MSAQSDTGGSKGARAAWLPFAALALLALLWGYNWVVMKVGMSYAQPFIFAAMRCSYEVSSFTIHMTDCSSAVIASDL